MSSPESAYRHSRRRLRNLGGRLGLALAVTLLATSGGTLAAPSAHTIVAPYVGRVTVLNTSTLSGCGKHVVGVPTPPTLNLSTGRFALSEWVRGSACTGLFAYSDSTAVDDLDFAGPLFRVGSTGTHTLSATYTFAVKSHLAQNCSFPRSDELVQFGLVGSVYDWGRATSWSASNQFRESTTGPIAPTFDVWNNTTRTAYTLHWTVALTSGHTYVFETAVYTDVVVDVGSDEYGFASVTIAGTVSSFTVR